jgi:hypothetical protein
MYRVYINSIHQERKDTFFISFRRRRAAEGFQSLFSHTDGKIRDGYGEDGCGRKVVHPERLILICDVRPTTM